MTSSDVDGGSWLAVVGWDELVHSDAKRASPSTLGTSLPWHRTYGRLLDHAGYWSLGAAERGLFHSILLVHLKNTGITPVSHGYFTHKTGLRVRQRHLDSLVQAGLIAFCASKEQAADLQRAGARASATVEVESTSRRAVSEGMEREGATNVAEQHEHSGNGQKPLDPEAVRLDELGREIGIPF